MKVGEALSDKWIQGAINPGKEGAFTKQADAAGMGVQEFASKTLAPGSKASTTTKRRAQFAKNMKKVAAKKRRR